MGNKAALVFGGQGAQFTGMGERIYNKFPIVKDVFELASCVVGYDVAKMCFNAPQNELNKTMYCQICTLAVELAIYRVYTEHYNPPDCVAGFSLGEYTALVAASVIDMKTAFKLVKARALSMEEEVPDDTGKMVAIINMNIEQIEAICNDFENDKIDIANFNAYNQIVISLSSNIYDEFVERIKSFGKRAIPLKVNRPFHHRMMLPAANKFKTTIDNCDFGESKCPVFINVTGDLLIDEICLYQNLYEQIFKPVQWIKIIENMIRSGITLFYEISPKPTLALFIQNIASETVQIIDVQNTL